MHGVNTAMSASWRSVYRQCLHMTFRHNITYIQ